MQASYIATVDEKLWGAHQFHENYERVSTLQQAAAYFSNPHNPVSTKLTTACAFVFEQHKQAADLSAIDRIRLWRAELLMEKNYPVIFHRLFSQSLKLDPPEDLQKKPELKPELTPLPHLPPYPKQTHKVEEGFVLIENTQQNEFVDGLEAHLKERELKFQTDVITLLMHDYGDWLFQNPTIKFLWQTQVCTQEQPSIKAVMNIIGFPEPSDFKPQQKALVLTILKGIEKFFSHFSQVKAGEDPVQKMATLRPAQPLYTSTMSANQELIRTSELLNGLFDTLLQDQVPMPYRSFLVMTLSMKATELLDTFLNPSTLFVLINHLTEIDFDEIAHDPNPPLEAFKADDHEFSSRAGQSIRALINALIKMIPVNVVEAQIMEQLKEWLQHNSFELGETLQLSIMRFLKSPGRLKLTQALFHLLWSVKDGKTTPVFPNQQKGEELQRAPDLLERKFVAFVHKTLKWKIDHSVSDRNIGVRLLAKVGTSLSSKPIKSNLNKLGSLLFKLLNNKRLLLMLIGYIADEFQLSKKE